MAIFEYVWILTLAEGYLNDDHYPEVATFRKALYVREVAIRYLTSPMASWGIQYVQNILYKNIFGIKELLRSSLLSWMVYHS